MRRLIFASCVAASLTATMSFAAAQTGPSDACQAVAEARVLEWAQARMLRDRVDTMADGSQRPSQLIFTENGMFEKISGVWRTGQATRAQRSAGSVEAVVRRMGLSNCASAGSDSVEGVKSAVYTYAEDDGITGKIWVSEASGLPLRAEIAQPAGHSNLPVKISMHYTYDAAVEVPNGAQLRDFIRHKKSQDWLRDQSSMTPSVVH
jgi:hypothetical protein